MKTETGSVVTRRSPGRALVILLVSWGAIALRAQDAGEVTVAPMAIVRERTGITGAGWGAAFDVPGAGQSGRKILNIYPNHPDDWGKTAGTGLSHSLDSGRTWVADADNTPIAEMVDLWVDHLRGGELVALGIRVLPDPKKPAEPGPDGIFKSVYALGVSTDQGKSWQMGTATVESSREIGPIARPLPHLMQERDGTWLMPAYSWGKKGSLALLLKSTDRGRNWRVAGTIATAAAIKAMGVPVTTPWFENMVVRTADGSLLAAIRTSSGARGAVMVARSTDNGATWSAPEKLLVGPQRRIVPGKLPNLILLRNGALVLLTAHTKNHCRLYVSWDGLGRTWSDGYVVTSQSGGNTSMVAIDDNRLTVFTPATGRISAWTVTVKPSGASRGGSRSRSLAAPTAVRATPTPTGVALSWAAPAGGAEVARYRITPVLVKPADADAEIYPYLPIETSDSATAVSLEKHFLAGAAYRFEVVAVDRAGHTSSPAASGEVVVGVKAAVGVN